MSWLIRLWPKKPVLLVAAGKKLETKKGGGYLQLTKNTRT